MCDRTLDSHLRIYVSLGHLSSFICDCDGIVALRKNKA